MRIRALRPAVTDRQSTLFEIKPIRGSWRAGDLALLRHPVALMRPAARIAAAALAWRATPRQDRLPICLCGFASLPMQNAWANALVPASRAWSPSEVAAGPVFRTPRADAAAKGAPKRPDFVAVRGASATSLRNPLQPLDSVTGQCIPCARFVSGGVMKCVACGAGMRLMQVETDTATVCGIERHIFRCSACPQGAQRLMFNRARMSSINLPDAAAARPEPPAIKLQAARAAPPSGWTKAIEKLEQQTDGAQGAKADGSDFEPAVGAQGRPRARRSR